MSTIILSDVHLNQLFHPRKYDFLVRLFSAHERIILNGDFWDGQVMGIDRFLKSRWNGLFPILKAKDTVYIYGNHDTEDKNRMKADSFSNLQVQEFRLKVGKDTLCIEHGNKIAPAINEKFRWLPTPKPLIFFSQLFVVYLPVYLFGKRTYRAQRVRNRMMRTHAALLPPDHILVCGHSHLCEHSLNERFLNCGFIRHGYAHYLRIENDRIDLVKERY